MKSLILKILRFVRSAAFYVWIDRFILLCRKTRLYQKIVKILTFIMSRPSKVIKSENPKLHLVITYDDGTVSDELLPFYVVEQRVSLMCGAFCHSLVTCLSSIEVRDVANHTLSKFFINPKYKVNGQLR